MARKKSPTTGKPRKPPVTVCRRFLEKLSALPDRLPDQELCAQAGLPRGQISRWKSQVPPPEGGGLQLDSPGFSGPGSLPAA